MPSLPLCKPTAVFIMLIWCLSTAGCTPSSYRQKSEQAAYRIITQKQQEALDHSEAFTIDTPEETLRRRLLLDQDLPHGGPASLGSKSLEAIEHWPEAKQTTSPAQPSKTLPPTVAQTLELSLVDALHIAALNSREYQTQKEELFRTALDLDLERDAFRNSLSGQVSGTYTEDRSTPGTGIVSGTEGSAALSLSRTLLQGATFTARLGLDLVRMLQPSRLFSRSIFGDASITIPLLRGAGRHIASESLTQAEQEMLYAVWNFEHFKREFVVNIFAGYLDVLKSADQVRNQEENYRGLIMASRRASRLAEAGKTPQIQVDQAIQNELNSRERWIATRQIFARDLDLFKIQLGLPTDAEIRLDRDEFAKLQEQINSRLTLTAPMNEPTAGKTAEDPVQLMPPPRKERGMFELDPSEAVRIALTHRLDLQTRQGRIVDAQRQVVVAADQLGPELTLFGSADLGQRRSLSNADVDDYNRFDTSEGLYTGLLTLDLPLHRTAEASAYRESYIVLERAVRDYQNLEDQIKLQIRNDSRNLEQARASLKIQYRAVQLAERRVQGASLNLEAGRAEIRDLLEAQEALVNAQNSLTSAMVDYRVAEIRMQADLGLLQVDSNGLWHENPPGDESNAGTP